MDDELLLLLLLRRKRQNKLRRKRLWVHPINRKRKLFGEFHHLVNELLFDSSRFQSYFRMSPYDFDALVTSLRPLIRKRDTNYREAISAEQRLAITLR